MGGVALLAACNGRERAARPVFARVACFLCCGCGLWDLPVGRVDFESPPESYLHHIIHRVGKDEVDPLQNVLGNLVEILFVAFRKNHGGEFGPFGRQNFFLQSSDGEHSASERDLACHRQVTAYRDL